MFIIASYLREKISVWLGLILMTFCLPNLNAQKVVQIDIDGPINDVVSGFIAQSIEKAEEIKAEAFIIQLNTPGGSLSSTRQIVTEILNSKVPVVVFVGPDGAHAGSAGVFITLAANIAAMAPSTNIGAAHPVSLLASPDSVMNEKIVNDASSFIKSIAEQRNKNWEWAVDAVRKSHSISAKEALEKNVIDLIANDTEDLLQKLDGREVQVGAKELILKTGRAEVEIMSMNSIDRLLNILQDPNIMYILFLIGLIGVVTELFNPGAIFPGVIGGISLILAFYAMSTLPVNYAGVALIVFAVILFLLEIKIISHGILSIGGVISLLIGSLMLIRKDASFDMVYLSNWVIFTSVVLTGLLFSFIAYMGIKAQKNKQESGSEGLLNETGTAISTINPKGQIRIHGEIWNAESEEEIKKGELVRILEIRGLTLIVAKN